ncbi:MAG: YfhO family protein, partial [Bacteroidales bacterium]|nr:YfhO family protein [Bacteroidales bacterium]
FPVLEGKIVNQSDISGYVGMSHEMNEWNKLHPDDQTAWTSSMFGGMPTTSITAPRQGDLTQGIYDFLLLGKRPATYIFVALLGAFLLMLSMGLRGFIAIGGAIAIAFCSYNFQIINVGHNTKMQAIAFLPWVLAAVIFTYKKALSDKPKWLLKTVLGSSLFALALSMQIKANHQQITYYLAIMIFVYAIAVFVNLLIEKAKKASITRFFIASALLLVIGCAGIATNTNKLLPLYKYTQYTMRGGSELKGESSTGSSGLSLDYATAWSYGWEELPNMMIPNFNGGSSNGAVNPKWSETYDLLRTAGQPNAKQVVKALPMYWGPQPFTAGPMYMGAISVFLFILGLMLVKGKDKWWIVIATVIAILLSLGSHLLWFTKLWYDLAPMYNKFRTVSMSLIVLQVTLPLLGFMALDRIFKGEYDLKDVKKKLWLALGITGGFSLLCWLIPGIAGSFTGAVDEGQQDILVEAFVADRIHLFRADALMTVILVAATTALIWWGLSVPKGYEKEEKIKEARHTEAIIGIALLVLINMFAVGKRYLSSEDFVTPRNFNNQFSARAVDEMILEDKDPSYRVVDLSVSVFNDSHPSYWHKNIGGYSPAKLQRYQDLIDSYLAGELTAIQRTVQSSQTIQEVEENLPSLPILSMLNDRYIILGEDYPPVVNHNAYGNAWFVDSCVPAENAAEEIALIGGADLRKQAVVGEDFKQYRDKITAAPADTIYMTSYAPNELRYHYSSPSEKVAVFSEVYYPEGWHLYLDSKDGQEIDLFRADWILRAAALPSGEHDLVMRFDPESYRVSGAISRASSIILILLTLASAAGLFVLGRKENE